MGELLFIGSCAGNFYAINKTKGELQWSYDIRQDGKQQSFHGNPLGTDELILIGTDKSCDPEGVGHVYAFERESGKVRWKYAGSRGHLLNGHRSAHIYGKNPSSLETVVARWPRSELRMVSHNGVSASRGAFGA